MMFSSNNRIEFSTMCRLCMEKDVSLVNLHPESDERSSRYILDLIETFTTIKIDRLDNLPQKICEGCVQTIKSMLAFRNKCKRSNEELQKIKQSLDEAAESATSEILDEDTKENIELLTDTNESDEDTKENIELLIDANEPDEDTKENIELLIDTNEPDDQNEYTFKTQTFYRHDVGSLEKAVASDVKRPRPEKVACYICGHLYDSYKLQFHINHHNGLKPYECDVANCTSKFAAPHNLTKHKRFCHYLERKFFCDVCGRGFKAKLALKSHMSYHFDPKLPCKICDKLFRNKIALKKHMLVHSQERKFKCDICGKSYQTRYTLRIHKRVHTQEKPYSCHCGVSFAYKCLLKTHEDKYHKDETDPLSL